MTDDSSTRSWEAAADDWVSHADSSDYQNLFLQPRMLKLAGDVAGRRVLDLGCGEGAYSRALARLGARVSGVDGSRRLVDVARQRAAVSGLEIAYHCRNANALEEIDDGSFDLIVASMLMMNVEDYPGGDARSAPRPHARRGAVHEHHASVFFRAGVRLGRRQRTPPPALRRRSLLRADRVERSHRSVLPHRRRCGVIVRSRTT